MDGDLDGYCIADMVQVKGRCQVWALSEHHFCAPCHAELGVLEARCVGRLSACGLLFCGGGLDDVVSGSELVVVEVENVLGILFGGSGGYGDHSIFL
jgi:hypothetical protein